MKIHVTGATGFVGQHFLAAAIASGHEVTALVRQLNPGLRDDVKQVVVGDIVDFADWASVLTGADAVVHLAARVHVMDEKDNDPEAAYQRANVDATAAIAKAAASVGVGQFVFMSSIKVNGEQTTTEPFRHDSVARPVDPYGRSKRDAEARLRAISEATGLRVAILRPTVVYGVGVGGNIRRIISAVRRGLPLPFGSINNQRSMVAVENLVVAILAALQRPTESDSVEVFLVADSEPVSTRDLVAFIAEGLGRRPKLIPVPSVVLHAGAKVIGRGADAARLLQDLRVVPDWELLDVDVDRLARPSEAFPALARATVAKRSTSATHPSH